MMNNQINLEIRTPCLENYNKFSPTENGGFCNSCKKEVIDFTEMSSQEIINHFNINKDDTCGKFKKNQIGNYETTFQTQKKHNYLRSFGLGLLSLFSFGLTKAQVKNLTTEQPKTITQNEKNTIKVKGIVSDNFGALPGVSVVLEGTKIGTETNFDGEFEFPEKLKKGDVLVFSFIGLNSKKVVIQNSESASKIELNVNMKLTECVILGKVSTNKIYKSKRN